MVFQNVYLFNDTVRANISFGRENVSEDEMIEAAKKRDVMILSWNYRMDTIR